MIRNEKSNYSSREKYPESDLPKGTYLKYVQKLNSVRKENFEIKAELKKLNKSLDSVLRKQKEQREKGNGSMEEDEELKRKIERKQEMIAKITEEISQQRGKKPFVEDVNKKSLEKEVVSLQNTLKKLEIENAELKKAGNSSGNVNLLQKTTDNMLHKEYSSLKEREKQLELMIIEDEKRILEQKGKVHEKPLKSLKKPMNLEPSLSEFEKEIKNLQEKVSELETAKKAEEDLWSSKLKDLKNSIEAKKSDIIDLEIALKEKDRNCRLKKMQIKAQQRENRISTKLKDSEISESID